MEGRVLDLAVGRDRVCALIESKADRFIRCWGGSQEHWPSPPEDEWRKVVCGDGHACALTKQGAIWCWGDNSKLQSAPLAKFGMVQVLESPKVVPLIRKAQALQTGALHTCALIGGYYSCFGVLGNGIEGL